MLHSSQIHQRYPWWKIENITDAVANPTPNLNQYDEVVDNWKSKDKVTKFLGMFTSHRFYTDWQAAEPNSQTRKAAGWTVFLTFMKEYYRPTENLTLKNFHFRGLSQGETETSAAFCNPGGKRS